MRPNSWGGTTQDLGRIDRKPGAERPHLGRTWGGSTRGGSTLGRIDRYPLKDVNVCVQCPTNLLPRLHLWTRLGDFRPQIPCKFLSYRQVAVAAVAAATAADVASVRN